MEARSTERALVEGRQRCFLGFELTGAARDWLREATETLHQKLAQSAGWHLRPVVPENWHMTLLFFPGLTAEERRQVWQTARQWTEAGAWGPLEIRWKGWALWPSPRRANLLCLEGAPYPQAGQWPLQTCLDSHPFNLGRTGHLATYRPHITLARFRRGKPAPRPADWERLRPLLPPVAGEQMGFSALSLFISNLSAERPHYPREAGVALPGRGMGEGQTGAVPEI